MRIEFDKDQIEFGEAAREKRTQENGQSEEGIRVEKKILGIDSKDNGEPRAYDDS